MFLLETERLQVDINKESRRVLRFRKSQEEMRTERKKYDCEKQKLNKGDWLPVCEKSENG